MKLAEHVAPQLIPTGELLTVPEPVPLLLTVNVYCGAGENVAVTLMADVPTGIEQVVLVPEHAPVHPPNTEPGATGVAVRTTVLPLLKLAEQVAPHVMPAGELLTDPEPVPASVTVIGNVAVLKFALTDAAPDIVTVQVPVPEHPPPVQPVNTDAPDVGLAVSVTLVFCR